MEKASSARSGNSGGLRADLAGDIPVFAVGAILFFACVALLLGKGVTLRPDMLAGNSLLYVQSMVVLLVADIIWLLVRHRPARPAMFLRKRYAAAALRSRFVARMPMLAMIVCIMPVFSLLKPLVPAINPYDWDQTLIAWEIALFGTDAWRVLQPLVGYPIVTSFLSVLYHAWLLLMYPGTLVILFYRGGDLIRRQYVLSFVLIWTVIGGAMAIAFSSVGPCFLEPIMGNPHFADQMAYLRAANEQYPVLVLHVQEMLLDWHRNSSDGLGRGITAMPSMHVAMAFLYFLAIRHVSKAAGRFFFVFFVLIWVGSVHLAYHYALDGAVSVVATAILWLAAGKGLAWWDRLNPRLHFGAEGKQAVPA